MQIKDRKIKFGKNDETGARKFWVSFQMVLEIAGQWLNALSHFLDCFPFTAFLFCFCFYFCCCFCYSNESCQDRRRSLLLLCHVVSASHHRDRILVRGRVHVLRLKSKKVYLQIYCNMLIKTLDISQITYLTMTYSG